MEHMRLWWLLPVVLGGCAEALRAPSLGLTSLALVPPQRRLEVPLAISADRRADPQAAFGDRIAANARKRIGQRELAGGGRRFAFDSVGLVRAVMAELSVDVFDVPAASDQERNGVDIVYQYAALHGQLHSDRVPAPGDLVFLGKTRDADGDGTPDPLSHLGIISRVDSDGTAEVVTTTMTGVVAVPFNRRFPDRLKDSAGHILNGRLVTALSPEPQPLPDLFYSFAHLTR